MSHEDVPSPLPHTAPDANQPEASTRDYHARLAKLIQLGAGTLDIPASSAETPFTKEIEAPPDLIQRELDRVALHQRSMNVLLEDFVGPVDRVLDVGCGTGATTVAMALSSLLGPEEVIGVDPNRRSLEAAEVRALAHGVADKCRFQAIEPGVPLPFEDDSFPLVTCVSVLEYLDEPAARQALINDLIRVTMPGGYVFLATPSPWRLLDYHGKRLLGDWRRRPGFPWASPPWALAAMFHGCELISVRGHQVEHGLRKRGLPASLLPHRVSELAGWALPWQKLLARKRR
ncbi:class I SAM-dependent methyltransferase [Haliangium sp.]|uniref:class I SAM-dependent methyltransferase n=1 Tax=Haliangium sp. TaxID=2663208 RepID=UPI003D0B7B57